MREIKYIFLNFVRNIFYIILLFGSDYIVEF